MTCKKSISLEDDIQMNRLTMIQEKNPEKQLQSELIDKFIIANPRIEPIQR